MTKTHLQPEIISTKDLLQKRRIQLPVYQRPYKWQNKQVNQLIDDILIHQKKSAYRLGTIVFHKENQDLNIVDGQQRSITLLLIAMAICANQDALHDEMQKSKLRPIQSEWFKNLKFKNAISLQNIQSNYRLIQRRVSDFSAETVAFFYDKCQLVEVVLEDISEAFQFFDSQNARGRDLAPHDLLKAFHLREMASSSTESQRIETVKEWEQLDSTKLQNVFANYLYRIRNWTRGESARKFTKDDVHLFKGINPYGGNNFPYAKLHKMGHFYVDEYNQQIARNIDLQKMEYPFQLDQVLINGKRFFEMTSYYSQRIEEFIELEKSIHTKHAVFKALNDYPGQNRTGDQYVRNLFDCALLHYYDKFGAVELERAVEIIFIWAYTLRLKRQNVQLASADNYALESPFIFRKLKEAQSPNEILSLKIDPFVGETPSTKTERIIDLFKKLNYYHEQ